MIYSGIKSLPSVSHITCQKNVSVSWNDAHFLCIRVVDSLGFLFHSCEHKISGTSVKFGTNIQFELRMNWVRLTVKVHESIQAQRCNLAES